MQIMRYIIREGIIRNSSNNNKIAGHGSVFLEKY